MKSNIKYYLLIPAGVFPYALIVALLCIFYQIVTPLLLLCMLFLLFIVSFICNAVFVSLSMVQKWDARGIALANMVVKLIQIPAYLAIFVLGVFFFISVFTFAFSIFSFYMMLRRFY